MIGRVLVTITVLSLLALPAVAMAQDRLDAGWADRPSTLDGTLGVAEWAKATVVALTPAIIITEPPSTDATGEQDGTPPLGQDVSPAQVSGSARFMNDSRYLYVAVSLDIGAAPATPNSAKDMLTLWFEDEPPVGDGKWASNLCNQSDEGGFQSLRAYTPVTGHDTDYFTPATETYWCIPQVDPPGYRRAFGRGSANWEVRIDLSASSLQAAPGDCLYLGVYVGSEQNFDEELLVLGAGEWPEGIFGGEKPDVLGEVCLAEEREFVPEPGSMALLGTGLAGLGGYATLRWRSRDKE